MDFDPRDRDSDDDIRDVEMSWVEVRDLDREFGDSGADDARDRDSRERDVDPRDPFVDGLELPRGRERELVVDGEHRYELNGDDSRTLAIVGAFRVASEHDLSDPRDESPDGRELDLRHLRNEGLTEFVKATRAPVLR